MKWNSHSELAEQAIEHADELSVEEMATIVVELKVEGYEDEAERLEEEHARYNDVRNKSLSQLARDGDRKEMLRRVESKFGF